MIAKIKEALKKLIDYENSEFSEIVVRFGLTVGSVISFFAFFVDYFITQIGFYSLPSAMVFLTMIVADIICFRHKNIEAAKDLVCVMLVFVALPIVFFLNGAVDGGAVSWLVIGITFVVLVYKGKKLIVFLILNIAIDVGVYLVAYFNPEWIRYYATRRDVFIDSATSLVLVGLAVGLIIRFQMSIYNRQLKLIEEQKKKLEQSSRERDMFFASMSHELRTPINSIIGFNEMNLRSEITEEMADNSLNIKNSAMLLLSLVNDILDLSKIESNKMEIVPVNYDVAEFFKDLIDMTRVSAVEKRLEMNVEIDEGIPRVLRGDESKLRQIAVNIVTNAIKYTEDGSVTVRAGGTRISDYVYRLNLTVIDTGIGIKKEDIDHIYDAFRRVNLVTGRKVVGTGLGLAICKELIELMGGKITVDSIYTKGSTFSVILDQEIVNAEPVGRIQISDNRRVKTKDYYTQTFEASEAKLLVVDDNKMNRKVIRNLLSYTKVQVDEAVDWRECLDKTMNNYYHVILMDYMMNEKDGPEVFEEIKNQVNGMCRETPVVLLSAASASIEKKIVEEYGFDGFLPKPVDPIVLERTILKLLPEDVIEFRLNTDEEDDPNVTDDVEVTPRSMRKKRIVITTENISDLSQNDIDELGIGIISLYIITGSGTFKDSVEINNFNMAKYMMNEDEMVRAVAATQADYEAFFAEKLMEAEDVIHFSLAKNIGKSYENAMNASKGFDHVHVVNTGQFSGGMAMIIKAAAKDVAAGLSVDTVIDNAMKSSRDIATMIYLPNARLFYSNKFIGKTFYKIVNHLNIHLRMVVRGDGFKFAGFYMGRNENARRRFIRRGFIPRSFINPESCYLGHVELTQRELSTLRNDLEKDGVFENIYINDVSVASASNAGVGAICFTVRLNRRKNGSNNKEKGL